MTSEQAKSAVMASRVVILCNKFEEFSEFSDQFDHKTWSVEKQKEWLFACFEFHKKLLVDIDELLVYANGDLHPDLLKTVMTMRAFAIEHSSVGNGPTGDWN